MNSSKYITMWSVQGDRVLNTLEKDGIYYVKKKYLDQKYQDTAWIFKTAYDFFNKHAAERMPKPPEAESPVWMFQDSKWAVASEGTKILRLQVPEEKIIHL